MSNKPYVVVAGTDFSEQAVRALRVAYQQAEQHAPAELHVVHVTAAASPEPGLPVAALTGLPSSPLLTLDEQRDALLKHLDSELATLPAFAGSKVRVFGHVLLDTPSFALTHLASELEADLVVVGAHGVHRTTRWLLGSVAEGVVRRATCPVLVIPPKSEAPPVPTIEPPCPRCIEARRASPSELWCAQHSERHGRRHTVYQRDRMGADTNLPLVVR